MILVNDSRTSVTQEAEQVYLVEIQSKVQHQADSQQRQTNPKREQAGKQEQKLGRYGYSGTIENLARGQRLWAGIYSGNQVRELGAGLQAGGDQVSEMTAGKAGNDWNEMLLTGRNVKWNYNDEAVTMTKLWTRQLSFWHSQWI